MKYVLVLALAMVSTAAFARQSTTNLSCAEAAATVKNAGSIVLSTGAPSLYARFVANRSFCAGSEEATVAYVTTKDSNSCRIGYVCEAADRGANFPKKFPSSVGVCKEGTYGHARRGNYFPGSSDRQNDSTITVVCRAGKWVPANGSWTPSKTTGGARCKDGAVDIYPAPDRGRIEPGAIVKVCRGGVWYRK